MKEHEKLTNSNESSRASGILSTIDYKAQIKAIVKPYESVGRRFLLDPDDLRQAGALDLIRRSGEYDPEKSAPQTFITWVVKGSVRKEIRDKGWTVRYPKRVREYYARVPDVEAELRELLDYDPPDEDIAAYLSISTAIVREIRSIRGSGGAHPVLIADMHEGNTSGKGCSENDPQKVVENGRQDPTEMLDDWERVKGALLSLSDRDRAIIYLRYYQDMTQDEIAGRLGVSQMTVSRALKRTVQELREKLSA